MSEIIDNPNTGDGKSIIVTRKRVSKKSQAKDLYVKYQDLPREALIQKFIEELDIPENSAETYASICAKDLNESLGKEYKKRNVNKANSKRERAFQIYSANAQLPRKEIIEKMKNDLNMSYNSAATHCSLAHKQYRNGYGLK